MKKTIFTAWVKTYGVRKLAKELDIHASTIRKWRQGHCPKPVHMKRIRQLSKGRITYSHIIDEVLGGD